MRAQHISESDLLKLKAKLLEEKKRVVRLRSVLDSQSPVHDTDRLNDNAASDAEASEENRMITSQVMSEETSQMLKKIEDALKRIEEGTYGMTADGKPIPVERLMADPTATTLVHA